jgi:hypothetical protein
MTEKKPIKGADAMASFIPEATPAQRIALTKEAIGEEYEAVYASVAPAIWYVLFNVMQQKHGNIIHANAVFNSALSAFAMYIAACTSEDLDSPDAKLDGAISRIRQMVDNARSSGIDVKKQTSLSASTDGFKSLLFMTQGQMVAAFKELSDEINRLTEIVDSRK